MTLRSYRVAIVVVTHNSAAVLPGFFDSLAAGLRDADPDTPAGIDDPVVIVADNDSRDDTLARAADAAQAARVTLTVVRLGGNRGYAAGVNAGTAAAGDVDAVLVANPDVRFTDGALPRMLARLHATPRVGIVVPRIRSADGRLAFSLRRSPTLLRAAAEALVGNERAARLGIGEIIADERAYQQATVAAWATGCAMLISRECLNAVGPWDESFFLYSEETDFALRAHDRGFLLQLEPRAEIVHLGGESRISPQLWALLAVNRVRLYRKRHGAAATALFRGVVIARELSRAVLGSATSQAALHALLTNADPMPGFLDGETPDGSRRGAPG